MGAGRISFALAAILCGATGVARGQLTPQPAALTFPDTGTGSTSAPQTITWTNTGMGNVTINDITMGGANPNDFVLSNGPMFPLSLVPNAAITIDCAFKPTLGGPRTGAVQAVIAGMMNPISAPVSGKGIGPKITVTPSPIVCGNLPFGQMPPAVMVTVSNAGGANVTVNSIVLSGPDAARFSLSGLPVFPKTLTPMQSFPASLQFTPAQPGKATATLTVNSTDPMTPVLDTPVTGNSGDPKITLDIGTIIFGNQRVGIPSTPTDVNISNTGLSDLHITNLGIAGNNPNDFSFSAKPNLPATLAIGQSVKISLVFTPSAAGARTAQVLVTNDDPQAMSKAVPMSGNGTTPMAAVMPNMLDFGSVKIQQTGGANFTISNAGTGPVKVDTLTVTGNDAKLFTIPMMPGFTVPAMGSVVVQVNFKPVAIGMFTATANLTTDDPNLPNFAIPLTGAGVAPYFAVSPSSVDFGSVNLGDTAPPHNVTISNTGNLPLTIMSFMVIGMFSADYPLMNAPKPPLVIQPNGKTTFSVVFKPTINGGEPCNINLTTDDPRAVSVNIALSGFGRQALLSVSPMTTIDFGPVQVGTTLGGKEVDIENNGTADVDIADVKITGMAPGAFSIDVPGGGFTLMKNKSVKRFISFSPTMMGTVMAQIDVIPANQAVMPASVPLKGTGVSPMLTVLPTEIDFGPMAVGMTSAAETITVKNIGKTSFVVDRLTSTDKAFGPDQTGLGISVPAMGSVDLMATFTPSAEGDLTAQLQIFLKDSTVPGAVVTVKGTGTNGGKARMGGCALGGRAGAAALPALLFAGLALLLRRRRPRNSA
jgi:HYDIN/CFA65/VesB-like, Ig-like domain